LQVTIGNGVVYFVGLLAVEDFKKIKPFLPRRRQVHKER